MQNLPIIDDEELTQKDVRSTLIQSNVTNPALQRLQERTLRLVKSNEVITSYDRMHHRHSRS